MLERCWLDVRLAIGALSRARAFSAVAIATLALGIGGVTVMFTLVEGVLLRRWPVHDQSRLIVAWKQLPASGFDHYPFGDSEIEEVARSNRLLESAAGLARAGISRLAAESYVAPASDHAGGFGRGTALDESNDHKGFNRILDAAGEHRRGPHQMRDTFASPLLLQGAPITYVSSRAPRRGDHAARVRALAAGRIYVHGRQPARRCGPRTSPRSRQRRPAKKFSALSGLESLVNQAFVNWTAGCDG